MDDKTTSNDKPAESNEAKPGFFKRIFTKLDESMKEKADSKAQNSCCGDGDDKGGKCC